MRRVGTVLLVVILLATPLISAFPHPDEVWAQNASTATTTDDLNMRAQASMSGRVLLVIPRGTSVVVRGKAPRWVPACHISRYGWLGAFGLPFGLQAQGSPAQTGTVTESLNLRIGPSTAQRALMVIPAGATVTITGTSSGGYLAITYGGYSGYAHGDWIRRGTGTAPAPAPAPTQPPASSRSGTGKITEDLNLRSQANTTSAVITVMRAGANVTLTGKTSGSFYQVTYNGRTGWAHRDWIRVTTAAQPKPTSPPVVPTPAPTTPPKPKPSPTPAPPVTVVKGSAEITEALNLRSGANTTSAVLVVMPGGAKVQLTGKVSGLFYQVTYAGKTGWAHKDWIKPTQTSVVANNTARVTESVNLRGGPATNYKRISVLPAGVTVTLTGSDPMVSTRCPITASPDGHSPAI